MASRRIPYIVGNTRNRDHVYWSLPDRAVFNAVAAEETWPYYIIPSHTWGFPFSRDQMMDLAWRVKNWNISGTWGASVSGEDSSDHVIRTCTVDVTINGSTSFQQWQSVGGARQLFRDTLPSFFAHTPPEYTGDSKAWRSSLGLNFCTCNATALLTSDATDVFPPSPTTRTMGAVAIVMNSYSPRVADCVVYDGSFYPLISLVGAADFYHINAFVATFPPSYADGSETWGTFTIHCPSGAVVIPIMVHAVYDTRVVPGTETFNSGYCDIHLTPYDYFGYKNRDGNEVYNTLTGAQINDPFI